MNAKVKHVVPVSSASGLQCTVTPPWFVDKSEYKPVNGTFDFLINGERAFGEVHRAIEAAKQSVCIICWGFQPSMYFIRDGKSPSIGQLLEQKAAAGVKVRLLCYAFEVKMAPGPLARHMNVTGFEKGLNESNTPGRHDIAIQDRPPTSSDAQYRYDKYWYDLYDQDQDIEDVAINKIKRISNKTITNLKFHSRGFSAAERAYVLNQDYTDQNISASMRSTLAATPSHHQKMVLVDYESPADHIGFVMGHNMLDEYWDASAHSFLRKTANTGRNGALPREDLSSRVTGPICGDLFRNFAQAWEKETGENLTKPDFAKYPLRQNLGQKIQGQILRTQPQYKVEDIKKAYLQAVNNATQCIYIENQYFRWPPLADKIKQAAAKQTQWGRDPAQHSSLYLFVVTNSSDAGMGSGTVKTQEMLDSLGRADTMPALARVQRIERLTSLSSPAEAGVLEKLLRLGGSSELAARAAENKRDIEKAIKRIQNEAVIPEPRPGLKIHVCTLVPPDTPAGQPWPEVYVHSKLMLVNDTFMTLGSTNINTRSMEVDSELNIAHCNPHISKKARLDLWRLHTKGIGAQEDVSVAFDAWGDLINKNKENEKYARQPIASLRGFLRTDAKKSDMD